MQSRDYPILAEDPGYQQAWAIAAEHDLPILAHCWSVSDYNPTQRYWARVNLC